MPEPETEQPAGLQLVVTFEASGTVTKAAELTEGEPSPSSTS